MLDLSGLGKFLILLGLAVMVMGGVLTLLGRWPVEGNPLGWLGRLPGDLFIKREHFSFYFPFTTSMLISVLGCILLYFFLRH